MPALPLALTPLAASSTRRDVRGTVDEVDGALWSLVLLADKRCTREVRETLIASVKALSAQVRDVAATAFGGDAMTTSRAGCTGRRRRRERKTRPGF